MSIQNVSPIISFNSSVRKIDAGRSVQNNTAENNCSKLEDALEGSALYNKARLIDGFSSTQEQKQKPKQESVIFQMAGGYKKINMRKAAKQSIETRLKPEEIYQIYGKNINFFCRSGDFYNDEFIDGQMPDIDPDTIKDEYIKDVFKKAQRENRMIIDNLDKIDEWSQSSMLLNPVIVYRDAPQNWPDTRDNDGIITEYGFCSTSLEKGASLEGIIGSEAWKNKTYKIILPQNTKYGDLTYSSEKEIVLPRKSRFLQLDDDTLILLSGYNDSDNLRHLCEIFSVKNIPSYIFEHEETPQQQDNLQYVYV